MNNNLKIVIASCVSFTAGYFFANWRNEEYYFKQANEEVAAREEYWEDKLDEIRKNGIEGDDRVDAEIREAGLILAAAYKSSDDLEQLTKPEVRAAVLAGMQETKIVQYSDYTSPEEQEISTEPAKKTVEVITPEQFIEGLDGYENRTLNYHVGNDTLSSARVEEGKIDPDIRLMIMGEYDDILPRDNTWGDDDTFYIRNHELKYDYEIIREDGMYADESSGGDG